MKPITIIGAGAVGRSFVRALTDAGTAPAGIFSENGRSAAKLANAVGARYFGRLNEEMTLSKTVIIAVPDSRIKDVVATLIGRKGSFRGKVFLHTSGGLTSDELLPLKKRGASIGSIHPLQTFAGKARTASVNDIYCALEGDIPSVKRASGIARSLGMKYFVIRKKDKVAYHIAAVFASNYLVTVLSVAERVAKQFGLQEKDYRKIMRPLVLQTIGNVLETSPAEALTGPIMRGDGITVAKHIKELESVRSLKQFLPLYAVLGIETAHLAQRRK
ncbi:MAG: Rossmann-like and DUF2520 domain-containing protein [Bacteroidota bacterium]